MRLRAAIAFLIALLGTGCGGGFKSVGRSILMLPAPLTPGKEQPLKDDPTRLGKNGQFPETVEAPVDDPDGLTIVNPGDPDHLGLPIRGITWPVALNRGAGRHYPDEEGKVSFYKEPQRLATGERFDPDLLCAAHKFLPFGTVVRCTRTDTGESVVVTINDRGPYVDGRILDLSREAAERINLPKIGVAPCKIEILAYPLVETMGPKGNG